MFVPSSNVPSNMFSHNRHDAYLAVIKPKSYQKVSIQAHRPILYNVSDSFVNNASDLTERSIRQGDFHGLTSKILNIPSANDVVRYSYTPDAHIDLNPITDLWHFILILNKPQLIGPSAGMSSFGNMVQYRVFIYGYFLDEPINPYSLHMAQPTINPNAQMFITHKTVTEAIATQNMGGFSYQNQSVKADDQYINGVTVSQLSSQSDLHLTDPASLNRSISLTTNGALSTTGSFITSIGYGDSLKQVDAGLQYPKQNLQTFVQSLVSSLKDYNAQYQGGQINNLYQEPSLAMYTFNEMVSQNLERPSYTVDRLGLDPNTIIRLEELIQLYNPYVDPIDQQSHTTFFAANQGEITQRMLFSDVIASSAPTILTNLGLSSLSFHYESRSWDRSGMNDHVLQVYDHATLYPTNGAVAQAKIEAFFHEMRKSIFPMILSSNGDFVLDANIGNSMTSYVTLNFLSDYTKYQEPFEKPSHLDGLISPLFADPTVLVQNSSNFVDLLNSMSKIDSYSQMGEEPRGTFNNYPGHFNY